MSSRFKQMELYGMSDGGNGWRSGTDPILRWLRAGAVVAFVAVFTIVALDPTRDVSSELTILALAVGAVLILLGYQNIVKLPMIGRDPKDEEDDL